MTVDVAGADSGGAARFRCELVAHLTRRPNTDVAVIGLGQRVSPRWLAAREFSGPALGRIAVNNVGFLRGSPRIVLLRNALHFLQPGEEHLGTGRLRAQTAIVRAAARHAHVVVAPTSAMADRVTAALPGLRARVEVRAHPLTFSAEQHTLPGSAPDRPFVLCPMLPAAHKDAAALIGRLLDAMDRTGRGECVALTAREQDVPAGLRGNPRLVPIGPQAVTSMPSWYAAASAIYFPTATESFGYPLAEARVAGRNVIAVDSAQNREVAGPALCGYRDGTLDSLCEAVERAMGTSPRPDPEHFSADAYFTWLFGLAGVR